VDPAIHVFIGQLAEKLAVIRLWRTAYPILGGRISRTSFLATMKAVHEQMKSSRIFAVELMRSLERRFVACKNTAIFAIRNFLLKTWSAGVAVR